MKMLLNHPQHHHLSVINLIRLHDTQHLSSSTTSTARRLSFFPISSHQNPQNPETPTGTTSRSEEIFIRTHNAKSAAVILRHLSSHQQPSSTTPPPEALPSPENQEDPIPQEDKVKLLEMSLISKRTPQFPGSIYIQSSSDQDVMFSLPPIATLIEGRKGPMGVTETYTAVDDDEMLLKALKIRRKVTVEIFKQAMRKGKFGITYSTNLTDRLSDYIDYVMIQVASMKQFPQFSSSTFNVRARTFIDDSGVVPLIRWLKHNSLSYPQIGKLICMSRGKLSSIRHIAEWLKSIHVKGRFIGIVLTRAGGNNILDRSLEDLDESVEYLERNGVRRDWMGYVVSRCPEILNFSKEELKSRAEFYLNMGMDEKDFGTMVFDYPKVLGYLSMEEMNQKVAFLKEFGLSNEEVGRLLAFKPQLMACSIEQRWKPLVKYFYYLGISKDGMRRILTLKPMVFCIDLKSIIVPKVSKIHQT